MSLDVTLSKIVETDVFTANITHNLNKMADEAGIYQALWRPEELQITKAAQLLEPLRIGLNRLKDKPHFYKKFEPENKWGSYEGLVKFIEKYIEACEQYPDADVSACR